MPDQHEIMLPSDLELHPPSQRLHHSATLPADSYIPNYIMRHPAGILAPVSFWLSVCMYCVGMLCMDRNRLHGKVNTHQDSPPALQVLEQTTCQCIEPVWGVVSCFLSGSRPWQVGSVQERRPRPMAAPAVRIPASRCAARLAQWRGCCGRKSRPCVHEARLPALAQACCR
jgi:hypothetical protein